jgi:hypothetical protein
MPDRRIDSTEIQEPISTSKVKINGVDVEQRINELDTALGTSGQNHFNGVSSPLSSGPGTTVASLINELVTLVNTTKATADDLAAALSVIVTNPGPSVADDNNPSTDSAKTWASAFVKLYVDYRIENSIATSDPGDGDRVVVDGQHLSTKKTFSQAQIENMVKAQFSSALNDLEDFINTNL